MSDHLREQWRRLATRGQTRYLILPNDPQRAHDAIRLHAHGQGLNVSSVAGDATWSRSLLHELSGEDSGFTVHDHLGDAPKHGYMVSDVGAEEVHPLDHLAKHPEIVRDFYAKHQAAMAHPKKFFGAWVSKGQAFLDVSHHHEDEDAAHAAGSTNQQLAIYDLARRKSVPVRQLTSSGRLHGRNPTSFADQVNAMASPGSTWPPTALNLCTCITNKKGFVPKHSEGHHP